MKTTNQRMRAFGMAVLAGVILFVPSMANADQRPNRDGRRARIARANRGGASVVKQLSRRTNGRRNARNRHQSSSATRRASYGGRSTRFVGGRGGVHRSVRSHRQQVWIAPVYQGRSTRVWVEPVYEVREKRITTRDGHGNVTYRTVTERNLVSDGYYQTVYNRVLVTPGYYVDQSRRIGIAGPGFSFGFQW